MVAHALVQGIGDGEAVAAGLQLGDRGDHAEIIEAPVAIELTQLFAIVLDAVGVIVVVGREEFIERALLGDDHAAQLIGRELHITQKVDTQDAALGAFVDLENQVHPALRQFDDLRRHRRRNASRATVKLDDASDILFHLGASEDASWANLNLVLEFVLLEVGISLEQDPIDDRIFDHSDDQIGSLQVDLHVREEIGAE